MRFEFPQWRMTCYGHQRGGANDVTGDTSPEEVWWAQLQAAGAGAAPNQLVAEFDTAVAAKDQQFNVCGD